MKILGSGGAGFVGSAVCRMRVSELGIKVVNIDYLTYAANLQSLESIAENPKYAFYQVIVCDRQAIADILRLERLDAIMHLAAESHIDRSITGPAALLDDASPREDGASHTAALKFVEDRPGHDYRYAIDPSKIERESGWKAQESVESGLKKTVSWYLTNEMWWLLLRRKTYAGERPGLLRKSAAA